MDQPGDCHVPIFAFGDGHSARLRGESFEELNIFAVGPCPRTP